MNRDLIQDMWFSEDDFVNRVEIDNIIYNVGKLKLIPLKYYKNKYNATVIHISKEDENYINNAIEESIIPFF